jgi:hypothetical protein
MFDGDACMPRINRGMVCLGACLIAGIPSPVNDHKKT